MISIFFDTNIIIDILKTREPFSSHSRELFRLCARNNIEISISALTVVNVIYITKGKTNFLEFFKEFNIVELNSLDILTAFEVENNDYEDAIQYLAAQKVSQVLITRDKSGFSDFSDIKIFTPEQFLDFIN